MPVGRLPGMFQQVARQSGRTYVFPPAPFPSAFRSVRSACVAPISHLPHPQPIDSHGWVGRLAATPEGPRSGPPRSPHSQKRRRNASSHRPTPLPDCARHPSCRPFPPTTRQFPHRCLGLPSPRGAVCFRNSNAILGMGECGAAGRSRPPRPPGAHRRKTGCPNEAGAMRRGTRPRSLRFPARRRKPAFAECPQQPTTAASIMLRCRLRTPQARSEKQGSWVGRFRSTHGNGAETWREAPHPRPRAGRAIRPGQGTCRPHVCPS